MACTNYNFVISDSRFAAVREYYKNNNMPLGDVPLSFHIIQAREYYGYGDDWIPETPAQFGILTRWINSRRELAKNEQSLSNIKPEDVKKMRDTLYTDFTGKELEDSLTRLARDFSIVVNRLQAEDRDGKTRQQIIAEAGDKDKKINGYTGIMKRVFAWYKTYYTAEAMFERWQKKNPNATEKEIEEIKKIHSNWADRYQKIIEHGNALAAIAAGRIGEAEGFYADVYDSNMDFDVVSDTVEDAKNPDEATDATEGSKGERYADFRLTELYNSLSPRLRRALNNIAKYNIMGEIEVDPFGRYSYMDARYVTAVLQKLLTKSTPESMISDLEKARKTYPWILGVLNKIDKEPDFAALLYSGCKSAKTTYLYSNINKKTRSWDTGVAGDRLDGYSIAKDAQNNLSQGVLNSEYSFYENGEKKEGNALKAVRKHVNDWDAFVNNTNILQATDKKEIERILANYPEMLDLAVKFLEGLGIEVKPDSLYNLWLQPMTKDWFAYVEGDEVDRTTKAGVSSVASLPEPNNSFDLFNMLMGGAQAALTKTPSLERAFSFAGDKWICLSRYLSSIIENETENRVNVEGKSLASRTHTNLLHQAFSLVESGSQPILTEWLDRVNKVKDLLQYEGIGLNDTSTCLGATGWLQSVLNGNMFQLVNLTAMNHTTYAKYDERQRTLNQLIMYFSGTYRLDPGQGSGHLYSVNIQADYDTADDYIQAPDYNQSWVKQYEQESEINFDLKVVELNKKYCDKLRSMGLDADYIHTTRKLHLFGTGRERILPYNTIKAAKKAGIIEEYVAEYGKLVEDWQKESDEFVEFIKSKGPDAEKKEKYVVYNGKLYASGVAHQMVQEVRIELERIAAIKERLSNKNHIKMKVYDKEGIKFSLFPEFNENGFLDKYLAIEDTDKQQEFIYEQVEEQLKKIRQIDIHKYESQGIFSDESVKTVDQGIEKYHFYSKTGAFEDIAEGESEQQREANKQAFLDMCDNYYFARYQMAKLFLNGYSNFNGLADFEKRSMMLHTPRSAGYTELEIDGKKVKNQNVIYIADDESDSAYLKDIKECLKSLKDKDLITQQQYETMWKSYQGITTTDGQAFRTLDSWRQVCKQYDMWSEDLEEAYQRIKRGKILAGDINTFLNQHHLVMNGKKPVFTGYEFLPAEKGNLQKPLRIPVFHKYSEQLLLPLEIGTENLTTQSVPLQGLLKAQKALEATGKTVDMFIFTSGVKVGCHSAIQPFAKNEDGSRILTAADQIANHITNTVAAHPEAVHTLSYDYYGMVANVDSHAQNDRIAIAAQAEKMATANIEPGQTVSLGGQTMRAADAVAKYYEIKTSIIVEEFKKLSDLFHSRRELARVLRKELASKKYASKDVFYAFMQMANGDFYTPLYTPGIEHTIQELLTSIITKRLTKTKQAGANILQSTGFGMDIDTSLFDNENALSEEDKLKIVFVTDDKGRKYIKEVEVFAPIYDSRLLRFADKHGCITPKRLRELVENGTIPESMLRFVAYRTPSDGEHSIIPCKIKGFITNAEGATLKMPKEIMVMTGHDYDGDKMRCHFKSFSIDSKDSSDEGFDDATLVQQILGQKKVEDYSRWYKCTVDEFDYDISTEENSRAARNNARVDILYSLLSCPEGTSRMLIPGGCDKTKILTKSINLTRLTADKEANKAIKKAVFALRVTNKTSKEEQERIKEELKVIWKTANSRYAYFKSLSPHDLSIIQNAANGVVSPWSVTHSIDSFVDMMGGASLIDVYAMNSAACTMFQRANLIYKPYNPKKPVTLFGNIYGKKKMFSLQNAEGELSTLTLSRWVNAAVDNGKDPVLGLVNQAKEIIPYGILMIANGTTEEQVHLMFSQPVIYELVRRIRSGMSIRTAIESIKNELALTSDDLKKTNSDFRNLTESDLVENLSKSYSDVLLNKNFSINQYAVLDFFDEVSTPTEYLRQAITFTRPDAASAASGTSVADIIAKNIEMQRFIADITNNTVYTGIEGLRDLVDYNDNINADYSYSALMDACMTTASGNKSVLPEVTAYNTLMLQHSLLFLAPVFPQAKQSWIDVCRTLASAYHRVDGKIIEKIGFDMILWKLLSDKDFAAGDITEEQKKLLGYDKNTPSVADRLLKLNARIKKALENKNDAEAQKLKDNSLLRSLQLYKAENSNIPEIRYTKNALENKSAVDNAKKGWHDLLHSSDTEIRQFGIDLFKYTLYKNGLYYGMYNFNHLSPITILDEIPEYGKALRNLIKTDWSNSADTANFIRQYYLNHWQDKGFVSSIALSRIKYYTDSDGSLVVTGPDADTISWLRNKPFIKLTHGVNNSTSEFFAVSKFGDVAKLRRAKPIGFTDGNQQLNLQYNPTVYADEFASIYKPDAPLATSDIANAPKVSNNTLSRDQQMHNAVLKMFGGIPTTADINRVQIVETKAQDAVVKNIKQKNIVDNKSAVTNQLIAHLKKIGINVYGRSAMAEYLKTHDITNVQTFIDKDGLYNATINITQNASGRLGESDLETETLYRKAKVILRNPNATEDEIKEIEQTLKNIYAQKKDEMQQILNEFAELINADCTIEEAGGTWLGGEEYSFRINIKSPSQEDYDKTLLVFSYIAEGLAQDAFIENSGEVNEDKITDAGLLSGDYVPAMHIIFARTPSARETALIQKEFIDNSTDKVPLDATITSKEIVFNFPSWLVDSNLSEKERLAAYKNLLNKWSEKIKQIINKGKDGRFKDIYRKDFRRNYERIRFYSADSTESNERSYSGFRHNNFSAAQRRSISEEKGKEIRDFSSRVVSSYRKDIVQTFTTSQGEIYGFVDKVGNIYLDTSKISPEHPIHEYTHLWDRVVQKNNPALWKQGVALLKQLDLWNQIAEDKNYGKLWESKGISGERLENLIASEVHSRVVGKGGERLLDGIATEKGKENIIAKLKQWILETWKTLKATFSDWSEEDLSNLTLKDFNRMPIRDFVENTLSNTNQITNLATQEAQKEKFTPNSYEGMITPDTDTIFVFGSNPEGRHGAGAAKTARLKFGAKYGQGEGLQGNAYALPTKDLRVKENNSIRSIPVEQITENIRKMYDVARQNPSKQFKVAYTHGLNETSLNGYTGAEMIKMFKDAGPIPSNVIFSKNWTDHWNEVASNIPTQPAQSTPVTRENFKLEYQLDRSKLETDTRYDQIKGLSNLFKAGDNIDLEALAAAEYTGEMLHIIREDEETGEVHMKQEVATPDNIALARKQETFVRLNQRLKEILREKGISVGVLTDAEARLHIGGITTFDTAPVLANGLVEMIRLAEGFEGEYALPEEFAHIALEMLGHDNPLVTRLLDVLRYNEEALKEAYEGQYEEYVSRYGNDRDKLILEAAGKLIAKQLFRQEEIQTSPVKRLLTRIIDAIKSLFRKFSRHEVQNAIFDAEKISSQLARDFLGGKLLDNMSLENISHGGVFYSAKRNVHKAQTDISGKQDILTKLLKLETKKYAVYKKRAGKLDPKTDLPPTVQAAQIQMDKLNNAINNHKEAEAVLTYLDDTLNFLAETEKSLDERVASGASINKICTKLNTVRDTIYSAAKAVENIRTAITTKELADSAELTSSLATVSEVLSKFNQKYNALAETYLEEMLAMVYGREGTTVTVGKDRGRKISIHEMATKADSDISWSTRMFQCLADCPDYVLKAVDDIVRTAKRDARMQIEDVKTQIEVAVAKLLKETGSRDQSFMFATHTIEGVTTRTGTYITEEKAKTLPKAQYDFYKTMMEIKQKTDEYIPSSYIREPLQIIAVRKNAMEKFKEAGGLSGKGLAAIENLRNRFLDTSDSFDPEYQEVVTDFQGSRVDSIPIKYMNKSVNESWDDMTDDVATSLMAYAGMAYQYNSLHSIVGMIENAKYMAAERDVLQKTGSRTQRETVETDDVIYREPYTKKAAGLHAQQALQDFLSMHMYGHLSADEGTFGDTRISKRKVVNFANNITSLSQMAINLSQRLSNVLTGVAQITIESSGRGVYNVKDVAWASAIYMKESADRMAQTGQTESDNKLSLWLEHFDVHQDNGRKIHNYKKGRISRIFNTSLLYAGLQMGEDYLSSVTSLAAARNFKCKDANGKETNLWDAYEVKYLDATNKTGAYLSLKKGYTKADGTAITSKDEAAFEKQVVALNFELQGIYNYDDRSAIQQYSVGALIIMYRKWIAPAIKRRYGTTQYNAMKGSYEEGYYRTLINLLINAGKDTKNVVSEEKGAHALMNIITDVREYIKAIELNYSKFTPYEKSNITRALTDMGIVLGLVLSCAILLHLPPEDHDGDKTLNWLDNLALSQLLRVRSEMSAQSPFGIVPESMRILKSPAAALQTIKSTLNIFQLMLPYNYMIEIKNGKYKGHKKAYKYFREFPIISMFKKIDNFVDPTPLINYYSNEVY